MGGNVVEYLCDPRVEGFYKQDSKYTNCGEFIHIKVSVYVKQTHHKINRDLKDFSEIFLALKTDKWLISRIQKLFLQIRKKTGNTTEKKMSEVWEGESQTASNMWRAQPRKKSENDNKTTIEYRLTCASLGKWERKYQMLVGKWELSCFSCWRVNWLLF